MQALHDAFTSQEVKPSPLAPLVLNLVKQELDHPQSARLLTWVCANYYGDESPEEPRIFAEAADLLVDRFAASPGIQNFCESLGSGSGSPPWAGRYEKHLRTILDENQDRFVRCTALFALASVIQAAGEARQDEAEGLYQRLVKEFEGHDDPSTRDVVGTFVGRAKAEAAGIRARGLGKPAPEIEGEDLDGRPMTLSDFRGNVVLVSFWATWCGPCMELIPHERALLARLKDKPFAIVGVNGDVEPEALSKALKETVIPWRSFQNKRADKEAISVEWRVFGWPTLYLIDHRGGHPQALDRHPSGRGIGPRGRPTGRGGPPGQVRGRGQWHLDTDGTSAPRSGHRTRSFGTSLTRTNPRGPTATPSSCATAILGQASPEMSWNDKGKTVLAMTSGFSRVERPTSKSWASSSRNNSRAHGSRSTSSNSRTPTSA
ncbi:MAG: TlpA disulfide reductase family protein [Singulisphaera sp.]